MENGQTCPQGAQNDEELDWEISQLLAGEGRLSSNAVHHWVLLQCNHLRAICHAGSSAGMAATITHPRLNQQGLWPAPASASKRQSTKRQEGSGARSSQPTEGAGGACEEKQRKVRESGVCAPSARAASLFDPTQLPKDGAGEGEGDGADFNSAWRGRQSAARGDDSTTKRVSRSPRGDGMCVALWRRVETQKKTVGRRTQASLREAAKGQG